MPGADDTLSVGTLTIDAVQAGPSAPLALWWRGRSTERSALKVLDPFLSRVVDGASARRVALELHFEELDYLNSSTLTAIIQVVEFARVRTVRIAIVFNPARRWQKLTFEALMVLVRDDGLVEMRAVGV